MVLTKAKCALKRTLADCYKQAATFLLRLTIPFEKN